MFKFLHAPFGGEVKSAVEKYTSRAHSAIVWESSKGVRLITASSATSLGRQQYKNEKMQGWLANLNSGQFRKVSQTLRVIFRENMPKPRPKPFYPSFTGHGGSGVDGYW